MLTSIRSLTATLLTTPVGVSLQAHRPVEKFTVVYTDSAPGANSIAIQVLLTDGITWATIFTFGTTKASDTIALNGPYLDIRAVVLTHTVSGTIAVDIFGLADL